MLGGYDAMVEGTDGEYTLIQDADDALDAADGYTLYVKGGQTYSETVTVSTNDNTIVIEPLTVITSLVLSGARNTVVFGASCQITGALTLSGANNVVKMGPAANLDGAVSITGDDSIIELGAESNLATTLSLDTGTGQIFRCGNETQIVGNITLSSAHAEIHCGSTANIDGTVAVSGTEARFICGIAANLAQTLAVSGANAYAEVGGASTITGAVSATADDATIIVGPQGTLSSTLSLDTGTGQICRCGNETQIVGNITVSSADAELHMGSTANIDGTVTLSGANTQMSVGDNSSLAQTLTYSAANARFIAGHTVQIVGNISIATAADSELIMGNDANIDGTVSINTQRVVAIFGGQANFAQTVTVSSNNCTFRVGDNTQIVGNILVSGASATFEAGSSWNFDGTIDINSGGDQCKMTLGANGNLAGSLTTGKNGDVRIGSGSTLVGAVAMGTAPTTGNLGSLVLGHDCELSSTLALVGNGSIFEMGISGLVTGAITVSGTVCKVEFGLAVSCSSTTDFTSAADNGGQLIYGGNSNIVGAVTYAGDDGTIRAGASANFDGIVTLSGEGCSLICENGCDLDGIVVSGASCLIDGGGLDTLVNGTTANHAIHVSNAAADNVTIKNIAVQTTTGGTQPYSGIVTVAGADYITLFNVRFAASDVYGANLVGDFAKVAFCEFLGSHDSDFILFGGDRWRVVGTHFGGGSGGQIINTDAESDKGIAVANLGEDTAGTITLASGADNSLVVANITDVAVSDSSTSSTVANNEVY